MQTRIISLALTLCLLLTACGGREAEDSRGRASLLAQAANIEEEEILLVVDGREVPAWRYLYWLAYLCDRMQRQYEQAELPLDWAATVSGGTLADYARDQALADAVLYATVENWAEEYGVTAETAGDTAGLPEEGLTAEQMAELEWVGQLYAALYDLYCTPDSPLAPSEEELRRFAEENGWLTVERILIPYGEDREAARDRAAEVFARINGAENQGTAFSELAGEGGTLTLQTGDGTLSTSLEDAAAALEEGQFSGILESEEGFALLRRGKTNTEAAREAHFDALLQMAAERAEIAVTEAYRELDIPSFHNALMRLREAEQE